MARGQRHRGHELQLVAPRRHQPGLQAALGAEAGDPDVRVKSAQRVGKGQRWFDMTGRPAAGEDHPHARSFRLSFSAGRPSFQRRTTQAKPA